jgi:DNA-binding XRE family transcriptional regulator
MLHFFKIKTEICNTFRSLFLILIISTVFYSCVSLKESSYSNKFPDIGIQIKKHRIQRGYSIKELANAVEISEQTLKLIEKGHATPIYPKLIALQEFLETEFVLSY